MNLCMGDRDRSKLINVSPGLGRGRRQTEVIDSPEVRSQGHINSPRPYTEDQDKRSEVLAWAKQDFAKSA